MLKAWLLFMVNILSVQLLMAQVRFSMPLKGVVGQDFFIIHYPDHGGGDTLRDAFCGQKTYNGHKGTDMALSGFGSMDTGVYIYAVADGRVVRAVDWNYDRNKHLIEGTHTKWNFVEIQHGGGIGAYYGHMRKGSAMVRTGDSVREGQPIGMVGSSGYSDFPHLHFEVWNEKGQTIDPFKGSCFGRPFSYWKEQPDYDTSVVAMNAGFVPYIPQVDTLMEGYLVRDEFGMYEDPVICFWAYMHGLRKGSAMRIEWYNPKRKLYHTYNWKWERNNWYNYTWSWIKTPTIEGKWLAVLYVNGEPVANRYFYVER